MKFYQIISICLTVALLLFTPGIDARKKNKSGKSKTKTKISTTSELSPNGSSQMVASEEHGYYVRRTFVAADGSLQTNTTSKGALKSIPYLAIPIAWFPCPDEKACQRGNSAVINSGLNSLTEGFLCDDDCIDPYEPICGRTPNEIAVFYNKCKLHVAKCRTHGYWIDLPYEECQKSYQKELEYAEQKFRSSPSFKSKEDLNTTTDLAEIKLPAVPISAATEQKQKPEITTMKVGTK